MNIADELKKNITSVEELKKYFKFSRSEAKHLEKIISLHPMSITPYYFSLIDFEDAQDPIRKMIVPSTKEFNISGSYDTSGEKENTKMPGLQHKYSNTALILSTNRCFSYCRHCFRKRLVGLDTREIIEIFNHAVEYITAHSEINNVLISGGDPFVLDNSVIEFFLKSLCDINQLDFIRFGTRAPVVFPQRIIEDRLLQRILKKYSARKKIYIVTHFNHPREITDIASESIHILNNLGIIVSNQAVLLKGINDNAETLIELMKKIVKIGVVPYYVFQCRPVKRVKSQYQIPLKTAYTIVENARKNLDGHSKRFKFVMSHRTGKIEICGIIGNEIYLKYHQAKDDFRKSLFFKKTLTDTAGWFDELK